MKDYLLKQLLCFLVKINDEINKEDLNLSIKKLYKTNYFKDIKILITKNKILEIKLLKIQ